MTHGETGIKVGYLCPRAVRPPPLGHHGLASWYVTTYGARRQYRSHRGARRGPGRAAGARLGARPVAPPGPAPARSLGPVRGARGSHRTAVATPLAPAWPLRFR